MERKQITTEQIEKAKEWKDDFVAQVTDEGTKYIHRESKCFINAEEYCNFLGLDEHTMSLLGVLGYAIHYFYSEEEGKYVLKCNTYIGGAINERLSVALEDNTDWLGLFSTKVGKAQWLPSNWKELITDEQLHDILQERNIQTIECLQDNDVPDEMKEEIAREWCKENSEELKGYLSDSDKSDIAYDYMDENSSECVEHSFGQMGSSEQKDFIKDCIDRL